MQQSNQKAFVPLDLKPPAVKLARRIQALMASATVNTIIKAEIRPFEDEWYLSIDHGKWEKLG
jgi:hypothetical protein